MLSKFRTKSGLDPLEVYWHNLYLDEKHFINACKKNNLKLIKKLNMVTIKLLKSNLSKAN